MSVWAWIVLACVAAYALKILGYLVPAAWLARPAVVRISGMLTIGLLAALVAMNAVSYDGGFVLDSRLGALVAAAAALMLRAPFILVVVIGALAAAGLRLLGFP